jgi:hypothetical protein
MLWMIMGALISALVSYSMAQPTTPGVIPGCVFNSVLPTLTNGQQTVLQCDTNGKLRVNNT